MRILNENLLKSFIQTREGLMRKLLLTPIAYILVKLFKCEVWYFTGKYNKVNMPVYNKFKF